MRSEKQWWRIIISFIVLIIGILGISLFSYLGYKENREPKGKLTWESILKEVEEYKYEEGHLLPRIYENHKKELSSYKNNMTKETFLLKNEKEYIVNNKDVSLEVENDMYFNNGLISISSSYIDATNKSNNFIGDTTFNITNSYVDLGIVKNSSTSPYAKGIIKNSVIVINDDEMPDTSSSTGLGNLINNPELKIEHSLIYIKNDSVNSDFKKGDVINGVIIDEL